MTTLRHFLPESNAFSRLMAFFMAFSKPPITPDSREGPRAAYFLKSPWSISDRSRLIENGVNPGLPCGRPLHLLQPRLGRPGKHLPRAAESRPVTRAIPCLVGGVPMDETTQVRAYR